MGAANCDPARRVVTRAKKDKKQKKAERQSCVDHRSRCMSGCEREREREGEVEGEGEGEREREREREREGEGGRETTQTHQQIAATRSSVSPQRELWV